MKLKLIYTISAGICFAMAMHDFGVSRPWMLYDLLMTTGFVFMVVREPLRRA